MRTFESLRCGIDRSLESDSDSRLDGDERVSDLVARLVNEATADWREGFGTLPADEAAELEWVAAASRNQTSDGLASRQRDAIVKVATVTDDDDDGTA